MATMGEDMRGTIGRDPNEAIRRRLAGLSMPTPAPIQVELQQIVRERLGDPADAAGRA
jgi:hypothetical protein